MQQSKYRPENDKHYRQTHSKHRRYLSYRSTARTFVKKYAKPDDIIDLRRLWARANHDQLITYSEYEKTLIRKLKLTSQKFSKFMNDMAAYHFTYDRMKDCLDNIGRMEAFGEALMIYDPTKTKFCKELMTKANQIIINANHYADKHK